MQLAIISSQSGHRIFLPRVICKRILKNLDLFANQKEKVAVKILEDNIHIFCHKSFHSSQKILVLYYFSGGVSTFYSQHLFSKIHFLL